MNKEDRRRKVLFVCIANACRSPMAEAIARRNASDVIEAFSAGLEPKGYTPWLTKLTLLKNGCWVEGPRSKGISPEVWEQAALVINMSGRPKELAFPEYSKVEDWEIEDPIGANAIVYQRVFEEIQLHIEELAQRFREEDGVRTVERRRCARLCPNSPMLMSLNEANDGIVLNVSEDGLALSTNVANLPSRTLHNMRVQLLESPDCLEACCRIVWKSKSNKTAGIQFVGLAKEKRRQIKDWLSGQTSASHVQLQIDELGENQALPLEIPSTPDPANAIPRSSNLPAAGSRSHVRTGRQQEKKFPAFRPRPVLGQANPVRQQRLAEVVILGILAGLSVFGLKWARLSQDARSEEITALRQEKEKLSEAVKSTLSYPPVAKTPSVPYTLVEKTQEQGANVQPPPFQKTQPQTSGAEPVIAETAEKAGKAPETSPRSFRPTPSAAKRPSSKSIDKTLSRTPENVTGRHESIKEPPRAVVNNNIRPVEKTQQQAALASPPTPPQLEIRTVPPVNQVPLVSNGVRPIEPENKASLAPAGKPPAERAPVAPAKTGVVAVVADPYLSLRILDGNSKKQHQGSSLEIGHLVARVEPVYPEEAKQQGIQGTVKLHAIINKHGSVEKLESVNGSPILLAAAMNAVRQWRYSETLLGGKSVETEEDIAIIFRLSDAGASNK